jgi:biotin/methionine sulfoxide reductase
MNDPLTLTHWGAYRVRTEAGGIVGLDPLPDDPDPSPIGRSVAGALRGDLRIAQPMVREGYLKNGPAAREGRGREAFVPVSWEQANALVAEEVARVTRLHGNAAIFGGSYGWASAGRFHHAQSQLHRFLNLCGGYTRSVNTHSYAAAEVLLPHVIGSRAGLDSRHTSWDVIANHTQLFVAFGGIPLKNAQVSAGGVGRHSLRDDLRACRAGGVSFVNISPLRDDIDAAFDPDWMPVRPNTDTALMLALAHTLVDESLHDAAFLARCTVGFDRFGPYLLGETDGQPKDADWASAICGVAAEDIRGLARRMAGARTMIAVSWSLQRADHGEQPLWAAIALAALLGQIGLPGGGFGFGYGGSNRIGTPGPAFAWPAVPQGENAVSTMIPVARLADMLLSPGAPFDYDGQRYRYPDIRLVWWAGGNPFHHQQDLNKLARAWRRPETVIVHEPWWNPLARHADIVLPCTTSLERNDLGIARDEAHLVAMREATAPVGAARSDFAILSGIAERLGFAAAFTDGLDEMGWVRHLYGLARQRAAEFEYELPDFETFWRQGQVRLPPAPATILLADFRAAPEAHPLRTPSGRIEIASARIAGFGYADCPGHPTWLEPLEWLGAPAAAAYPLHLISNQPRTRLHSQYDHGAVSRDSKVAGREPLSIHPADAARRGIADGDLVRVFSPRGECLAGAIVTEAVAPGCVQLATGAWWDPDDDSALDRAGNANVLTIDRGTSRLAQGPIAHTTLVEVMRHAAPAAAVAAFTPPPMAAGPRDAG